MEHEEVFKEQDLSLSDIAELDHEALKSIGIRLVKHRTAIIKYTSGNKKIYLKLINPLFTYYFSQQHSILGATDWRRGEARGGIITVQHRLSDTDQHGSQCRVGGT